MAPCPLERVQQCHQNPTARHADGMAQRDGTSANIHLRYAKMSGITAYEMEHLTIHTTIHSHSCKRQFMVSIYLQC